MIAGEFDGSSSGGLVEVASAAAGLFVNLPCCAMLGFPVWRFSFCVRVSDPDSRVTSNVVTYPLIL
jgi:hypothetical protein